MSSPSAGGCVIALDGVVFDALESRSMAASRALQVYPGVDAPPLDGSIFTRLLCEGGFAREEDMLLVLLRAAAAGVPYASALELGLAPEATLEPDLAVRLFEEHYIGAQLFEAARARRARYHRGRGTIELERLLMTAAELRRVPSRPCAAFSHRPRAEVLFKLLGHGVADAFEVVVTLDDVPPGAADTRAALIQEARQRLAALGSSATPIAWCHAAVDRQAARAAGLTVEPVPRAVGRPSAA